MKGGLHCSGALFDRLLVISQQRKVNMKKVMTYSLGEISWCLAKSDDTVQKSAKSILMRVIKKDLDESCYVKPEELPKLDALILDGMAEVQTIRCNPSTFGESSATLFKRVKALASTYKCN